MFMRLLVSLLLVASLAISTFGLSRLKQETPNQSEDETLRPDEEREARAFVEDFIERLEKSQDVTPLVKELYVSDFTERLRSNMADVIPLAATSEVAAQLSSDEILAAYAASTNMLYLASVRYMEILGRRARERAKRGEPMDSDEESDLTIEELIPPKLIQLIQSDPALAAILAHELEKEKKERDAGQNYKDTDPPAVPETETHKDAQDSNSGDDFIPFKSVDKMRHYTSLAEQGVALLREYINTSPEEERLSARESWLKLINGSKDQEPDENRTMINPRLHVLTEEFMGYSAGTRLICADVLIFHVDMVRGTDGQLKIVHMYLQDD